MKKITIITLLLLAILTPASAVEFNFVNPSQDTTIDIKEPLYLNSIVFQVNTYSNELLCRYSLTANTLFSSMITFDKDLGTVHKKTFTPLSDGVYRYFVKCRDFFDPNNVSTETKELEAIFRISNPISATQIKLSAPVLKAGKHEISLITTKVPKSTPILRYSYDGITYSPIALHGSEKSWKGFLVISSTAGEEVGSFKFEAQDLEGRTGTTIREGNIFIVDTRAPPLITSLEASGEYGQIKLDWFLNENEEIEKVNIYRSETPSVDLTNLYKTLEGGKEECIDTDVKNGKTYYYRISTEDEAGNTADLSREIHATGLLGETSTTSTGLNPSLIGSVDALLSEIKLLETDIKNSNEMIASLTATATEYLASSIRCLISENKSV